MKWNSLPLAAVFALAAATSAQAETVEVTFDVTAVSRYVETAIDGIPQRQTTTEGQPPLSIVYRFDTENPMLEMWGGGSYASSIFRNASSTVTPYTQELTVNLPPQEQAVWPEFTQIAYGHSISNYGAPTEPQQSWESMGFNTGSRWESVGDVSAEIYGYNRGLSWAQVGALITSQDLHAITAPEFVNWLQGQVGKPLPGLFQESSFHTTMKVVDFFGQKLISGNPTDTLAYNSMGVTGDVLIRSVALIPEPCTALLEFLGVTAIGMVFAVKRRKFG